MRSLLLSLSVLLVGLCAQAQTISPEQANARVGELLNASDYITLSAELPALRSMVTKPLLALSDALVAHCEGRFEDSNKAIDEVFEFAPELGGEVVFGMTNYALINHLCLENYAEGKALVLQMLSTLPDDTSTESSREGLQSLDRWMSALAKRPKVEIVRSKGDVTIPVERRTIGAGEHLIVKVDVGNVSEDFIFDTGCSHANFISRQAAERLGVEIVADSIIVHGVGSGYAQLGVLPEMRVGDVVVKNPTFLVTEHIVPQHVEVEGMCDAVLGTHIIRKLGEVRYERGAGRFVLPAKPGAVEQRNIICDNGSFYLLCQGYGERVLLHFDTGNTKSQLTSRYYNRFKEHVEAEGGDIERSRSGGFGGVIWCDVRKMPKVELIIAGKPLRLKDVAVNMPTKYEDGTPFVESFDGSAGVDLLTAAESVVFDLNRMYFRIDK